MSKQSLVVSLGASALAVSAAVLISTWFGGEASARPTTGGGSSLVEAADEKPIEISALPAVVKATAKRYFSALENCTATKEVEDGQTVYEVEGKTSDGSNAALIICSNGEVHEFELERSVDSLSAELKASLTSALASTVAGAKLVKVESLETHSFEIQFEKDGKRGSLMMSASGRVRKDEEGDESDEEDEDH